MKNEAYCSVLILQEVLERGHSLTQAFEKQLPNYKTVSDHPLIKEICFGVLRFYNTLQAYVNTCLKKPFKHDDQDIEFLLLIGAYQLLYLDRASHAVTFNTVAAVAAFRKPWAKNVVNAILRKIQREKAEFQSWRDRQTDEVRYAHPAWFIELIKTAHPSDWQNILLHNNEKPPLILRARDRDTYLQTLKNAEIEAISIPNTPQAVGLIKAISVAKLPGFSEGECSVQDTAAQYAAVFLDLKPGQRVLDACAAPGGKTTHILEREPALKELLAIDIDAARVERIKENLTRCKLKATTRVADATQPETWWDGERFDRILLDAPCSGTAVIRRHPDIKWLRRPEDIAVLQHQQIALLRALWPLLKTGGRLVYVTCSLLQEENQSVIKAFLADHPDASQIDLPIDFKVTDLSFTPDHFYYCGLLKQ